MADRVNRREFVAGTVAAAGCLLSGGVNLAEAQARKKTAEPSRRQILSFNENMEYRRLGKTGLMVSAVCMGGHWKRVHTMLSQPFKGDGYSKTDYENIRNPEFLRNRHDVISRCLESGINYIDACAGPEVMAYSHVLKGRRDKVYVGFSWSEAESRTPSRRTGAALLETLDKGLKEAKLDYADVWRITLPQDGISDLAEVLRVEEGAVEALDKARKQGKVRFTGVSTHNRVWLKSMIEQYPDQMQVVLFPYTAHSKELPDDSVFDAIKKNDVGVFGIKPFADNSLFAGDSSLNSPHREEDDRRARLAIRYILSNPAITAPIPGLANIHQVDNVAKAVKERRQLDRKERAELDKLGAEMWTRLRPSHEWLRDWEYV